MQDAEAKRLRDTISQCIWKTNEFGEADLDVLKINSEVATDNDKEEFLNILKTGEVNKEQKSNYARNFRFFKEKIDEFILKSPTSFVYFPARILNNCILLPIEAESQDTALRIFSTLNDRGLSLSDADIFKAQFYKFYKSKGKKDSFITQWKDLEELCVDIFHPITGTPMDELFTRYMYYERAKQGIKTSTTEALRKFYEKDKYKLLQQDKIFTNLITLAKFWYDVVNRNQERFSDNILRKLFILNYAPNGMWCYFVSVYFMHYKDNEERLNDKIFDGFLTKIIGFIWTYAVINPGVNALRTPVYAEMMNIVNGRSVDFNEFKFDSENIKKSFDNYSFNNGRPITKSLLTWWAFNSIEQELPKEETTFEIEHIFAKKRQEIDKSLKKERNIESLGNKSLLEKHINIRASDYKFSDKVKYYEGFINSKGKQKGGTQINELVEISKHKNDFIEKDIEDRKNLIIEAFLSFLRENHLLR